MNRATLLFALALTLVTTASVSAQEPVDYRTAYKKAQNGDKPLLVLVTAKWCPPCQVMKKTTIPALVQKKSFEDFHYATVDLDQEKAIGKQLIGDRCIPQLIMFEKKDDKWVRRYLVGIQTVQSVEAFVSQANSIRTAAAETTSSTK